MQTDSATNRRSIGPACQIGLALAVLCLTAAPLHAQLAPRSEDKVHFELMPYLVLGGISGDVTVRGRTAYASESFGDVLSNLQFGFMGRARIAYKKWYAGVDGSYIGLGSSTDAAEVGIDQVIVEPGFGYRLTPFFDVIGGARYNSLGVEMRFTGPLGLQTYEKKSWWDPFAGGRLTIPLNDRLSVSTRLDLGGFGVGSKIAVNAEPMLNIRLGKHGTMKAGWKFYYVDYKETSTNFRYAILMQGPLIGTTFRW